MDAAYHGIPYAISGFSRSDLSRSCVGYYIGILILLSTLSFPLEGLSLKQYRVLKEKDTIIPRTRVLLSESCPKVLKTKSCLLGLRKFDRGRSTNRRGKEWITLIKDTST